MPGTVLLTVCDCKLLYSLIRFVHVLRRDHTDINSVITVITIIIVAITVGSCFVAVCLQ